MASELPVADFRSDTVTTPTPTMLAAMATAAVGDDVFDDDPTVHELQDEAAKLLGKEAALFVPSGTMGNIIGVTLQAGRGDEVLVEEHSHTFNFEGGNLAWISGATPHVLPSDGGVMDPAVVRGAVRPLDDHYCRTKLLCIENTHNMHGGTVTPVARMQELRTVADECGLRIHLDGARLFNAAAAAGCDAKDFAQLADTVQVCLSKALGAPVGSLLLGTREQMVEGRRIRKVLGGGMRQVGVIAAAALVALREGPKQLPGDHARAKRLVAGFREAAPDAVIAEPETNLVFVRFPDHDERGAAIAAILERDHAVRVLALGALGMRFVLHHQITDDMIDRCIAGFRTAVETS